ncbi:hypothetical protein GCM10027193_22990 [Arenimonas aestuarii]
MRWKKLGIQSAFAYRDSKVNSFNSDLNDLVVELEQAEEARVYASEASSLAWRSFHSLRDSMVLVQGLDESEAWKKTVAKIKETDERYAAAKERLFSNGLAIQELAQRHPDQLVFIRHSLSDAYQRLRARGIK